MLLRNHEEKKTHLQYCSEKKKICVYVDFYSSRVGWDLRERSFGAGMQSVGSRARLAGSYPRLTFY